MLLPAQPSCVWVAMAAEPRPANSSEAEREPLTSRSMIASTGGAGRQFSGCSALQRIMSAAAAWNVRRGANSGTYLRTLELSKTALCDRSPMISSDQNQSGAPARMCSDGMCTIRGSTPRVAATIE